MTENKTARKARRAGNARKYNDRGKCGTSKKCEKERQRQKIRAKAIKDRLSGLSGLSREKIKAKARHVGQAVKYKYGETRRKINNGGKFRSCQYGLKIILGNLGNFHY